MNKVLTILVIILGLSSTFANENKQKKSRMIDRFRYEKYIDKPLKEASYDISSGTIKFKLSLWQDKTAQPKEYNCQMEFSRWPNYDCLLPQIALTIEDSIQVIMEKDSIYIFDSHKNKIKSGGFIDACDFLTKNQFISFYAYWYEFVYGTVANTNIVKDKNFISTHFEVLDGNKKKSSLNHTGIYNINYHINTYFNTPLLQKYTYEPSAKIKDKYNCEKIQYELIAFTPNDLLTTWAKEDKDKKRTVIILFKSFTRLHTICNSRTYHETITGCNDMILLVFGENQYPKLRQ